MGLPVEEQVKAMREKHQKLDNTLGFTGILQNCSGSRFLSQKQLLLTDVWSDQ